MAGAGSDELRRAGFEREALPHLDQVYTTALYLSGDPDRAADLVQETFLKSFRFFHRFELGTNCRAWLLTILHNTFRNRYRSERKFLGHVDLDEPAVTAEATIQRGAEDDPEILVLSGLLDHQVEAALQALPEDFRTVVVLVDLQDLTYEECASVVGCPIGTVRSRLSRARRLLASVLADYARERGFPEKRRQ